MATPKAPAKSSTAKSGTSRPKAAQSKSATTTPAKEAASDEVRDTTEEEKAVKAVDEAEIQRQEQSAEAQEAAADKITDSGAKAEKVKSEEYQHGDPLPVPVEVTLDDASAKAQKTGIYIVQGQETIADIATKFGIGVDLLAKRNYLVTGHRQLRPGQEIHLYERA